MHSGRTWETDASETGLVAEPTVFRVNQSSVLAAYLAARRANPPRCGRGEETHHFAEKACGIALSRSRRRRCAAQTGTADVTTPFPTRHFLWRSLARSRARARAAAENETKTTLSPWRSTAELPRDLYPHPFGGVCPPTICSDSSVTCRGLSVHDAVRGSTIIKKKLATSY